MSYDLAIAAGSGKKLTGKSFLDYFKPRRHYLVEDGQALYQNESTGVYFIFDEPDDNVLMFNLNYYRPHTFGVEAAIELHALTEAFQARVSDPQGDEAEADFDAKRFIERWNEGNQFAYKSMVDEADTIWTQPAKVLRDVWDWNYKVPTEEQQNEMDHFVPTIMAIDWDGTLHKVVIWPPECTIMLPEVDAVLVPLAQTGKKSEELAWVPWSKILPVINDYHDPHAGMPRYKLIFEQWPDDIAEFLSLHRPPVGELNGVTWDQILDEEMVIKARK